MNLIIRRLGALEMFAVLPEETLMELAGLVTLEDRDAGELLFQKGDPADALYLIEEGEIAIIGEVDREEKTLNVVGPGGSLGQMTLIQQGSKRTAGARVLKKVRLRILLQSDFLTAIDDLSPDIYQKMVRISGELRMHFVDLFKQLPLFKSMPDHAIKELVRALKREYFQEGQLIVRKGDPGQALFIIDRGQVKVTTTGSDDQEIILDRLGPGETVGEISLIDSSPQATNVVAMTPVDVLKLESVTFFKVLREHPEVALDILGILSQRQRFMIKVLQQTISSSESIARGNYSEAMAGLETSQMGDEAHLSDDIRVKELVSAFFTLIRNVQIREENLKQQVRELKIQIDEKKRQEEFQTLTSTDFFTNLKVAAKNVREQFNDEDNKESE